VLTETHKKKKAEVLESIDLLDATEDLLRACADLTAKLEEYNTAIATTNSQLQSLNNEATTQLENAEKRL
jgi:prefoldin subunit 5